MNKKGKIFITVIVAVLILSAIFGTDSETDDSKKNNKTEVSEENKETKPSDKTEQKEEKKEIEYTSVSVDDMVELLDENALKAEKTYQKKNVEVTGVLKIIDSDGDYISLGCINDEWCFTYVQCYIKNKDQLNKVLEMKTGDTVTLKGKITSIGEVIGYLLDIQEIE